MECWPYAKKRWWEFPHHKGFGSAFEKSPNFFAPKKAKSLPSKHGCELDLRQPPQPPGGEGGPTGLRGLQDPDGPGPTHLEEQRYPPPCLLPSMVGNLLSSAALPLSLFCYVLLFLHFVKILLWCPDRNTLCKSPSCCHTLCCHSLAFDPSSRLTLQSGDRGWTANVIATPLHALRGGRDRMGPYQEGAQP